MEVSDSETISALQGKNWPIVLILIMLAGNTGLESMNSIFYDPDLDSVRDGIESNANAIIRVSDSVEHISNNVSDLMDTINFIDIRYEINSQIDEIDKTLEPLKIQIRELEIDQARVQSNGNMTPDLESLYGNTLQSLKIQRDLLQSRRNKAKQELDQAHL